MIEIKVSRDVGVSFERVWDLIADFGNTSWMQGISKSEVTGNGPGMVRAIYVGTDAPPILEEMTALDREQHRVDYVITQGNPLPVVNYVAWVVVARNRDGNAHIDWCSTFDAKQGVDDATAKGAVEGMYGVLIDWVTAGAEAS